MELIVLNEGQFGSGTDLPKSAKDTSPSPWRKVCLAAVIGRCGRATLRRLLLVNGTCSGSTQ